MRLATWNVNSLTARMPRVMEWVEMHQPDVLCMQETKLADDKFPEQQFAELGYESAHDGDGRWNGVADHQQGRSRGRHPGLRHVRRRPRASHRLRRRAPAPRPLRLRPERPRPRQRVLRGELAWLARLRTTLDEMCPPGSSVAVCGDFNVAPDDDDVWDPAAFVGATHVSEPERAALRQVEGWGLDDVFRRFNEPGTFTWWDYRSGDFHQGRGMRIDLVLVSDDLVERATGAFRDHDAAQGTEALRPRSRRRGFRRLLTRHRRFAAAGSRPPFNRTAVPPGPCVAVRRSSSALRFGGAWPSPRTAEPFGQAPSWASVGMSAPGLRQERQGRWVRCRHHAVVRELCAPPTACPGGDRAAGRRRRSPRSCRSPLSVRDRCTSGQLWAP